MNEIAFAQLKSAFAHRTLPAQILRGDLCGVDCADAEDLRDALATGESTARFFHSAIPYFSFLTDDAALFYLPDLLSVFSDDRVELITVLTSLELDSGRRVMSKLSESERTAIHDWVRATSTEDHDLCFGLLERFEEVVGKPNQPVQHNAGSRPSSHEAPVSETPSSPGPRG